VFAQMLHRESRPGGNTETAPKTTTTKQQVLFEDTAAQRQAVWAEIARRGQEVIAETRSREGCRPPRLSGAGWWFREGNRRGMRYLVKALEPHLDELGKAKADAIIGRAEVAA
jgi:hypothetical protein